MWPVTMPWSQAVMGPASGAAQHRAGTTHSRGYVVIQKHQAMISVFTETLLAFGTDQNSGTS